MWEWRVLVSHQLSCMLVHCLFGALLVRALLISNLKMGSDVLKGFV